jgi:16S rRNA processing protein RimM
MERIPIGKTGKPHGIKGELKLWVEAEYEDDLLKAPAVFIGGRPFFVQQLRAGGGLILKIEGVDSREAAQLLANQKLELRAEDVAEVADTAADPILDLVGFELYDSELGRVGVIAEVIDMPQQYLAVVEYQQKEVLVPLHEDLIQSVDPEAGRITLQLPEGLLDL